MEKNATINVRINPQVKHDAENILTQLGLSMSTAIEVFLRQVTLTGGLPFQLSLPKEDSQLKEQVVITDSIHNTLSFEEVVQVVGRVSSSFPAIERVYLFGSFARGMQNDKSDIDLRIEFKEGMTFNLKDVAQFAKRIEQETGREVDVVSARTITNTALAESIEREKVLIYEC